MEGLRLSSAFDITCRAWKDRFNVEYTHCGCPIPGKTIGQRLSTLVSRHNKPQPSHLVPYDRPDLLSATHPSDHNAVRFAAKTERMHKLTTAKYENLARKQQRRKAKAVLKEASNGRPPTYSSRSRDRDNAFLVPVPIYFGAGLLVPVGAGVGGCVAADGGFANQVGGCSSVSFQPLYPERFGIHG